MFLPQGTIIFTTPHRQNIWIASKIDSHTTTIQHFQNLFHHHLLKLYQMLILLLICRTLYLISFILLSVSISLLKCMLLIGLPTPPVHLFNIFHSRLHQSLICCHGLIDNEKMDSIFDVGSAALGIKEPSLLMWYGLRSY